MPKRSETIRPRTLGIGTVVTKHAGAYRAWLFDGGQLVVRHDGRLIHADVVDPAAPIDIPPGLMPPDARESMLTRLQKSIAADQAMLLYHYRPLRGLRGPGKPIVDESVTIIREEAFHCSDPRKFRDQSDCQLRWWLDLDPAEQERFLRASLRDDLSGDDLERAVALHLVAHTIRLQFDEVFRPRIEAMVDASRILCLTTHPDNPMMWRDYAEELTGVCFELEFPADHDGPLAATRVAYRSGRLVKLSPDHLAMATALFATKGESYSDEDEYRCIDLSFDGRPNEALRVLRETVKGMILGENVDSADKAALLAATTEHRPAMSIRVAHRRPDGTIELRPLTA